MEIVKEEFFAGFSKRKDAPSDGGFHGIQTLARLSFGSEQSVIYTKINGVIDHIVLCNNGALSSTSTHIYNRPTGYTCIYCILACTKMTKNNKIRILQVILVVGLSWASNDINFSLKILHLAGRALP